METVMFPEMKKALDSFTKEMGAVDEVVHVLLKGHLLIEEALTRIIGLYLFHPEHLPKADLRFHQKMVLCRSLCLRKDKFGEWDLIAAINTLRNKIAHKLNSEDREKQLGAAKELYFREAAGLALLPEMKKEPDYVILSAACGHCLGFLATFEADSRGFRSMV